MDTLVHHRPYSLVDPGTVPPGPPDYPAANLSEYYDMREFPPGTYLPSPMGDNNTDSITMTCVEQLDHVPLPRFNLSAIAKYSTPYNFNWMECVLNCNQVFTSFVWFIHSRCIAIGMPGRELIVPGLPYYRVALFRLLPHTLILL
jgi:hypothetical protein